MGTVVLDCIGRVGLPSLFGGHKVVIGTVL